MLIKSSVYRIVVPVLGLLLFCMACNRIDMEDAVQTGRIPVIEPDYSGVTIPPNIAPLNFIIKERGSGFRVEVTSGAGNRGININSNDGIVRFPEKEWKRLLDESRGGDIELQVYSDTGDNGFLKYEPFRMKVAEEPIDPYLVYRLIHPGYYSWSKIKIVQRSVESFREESILENQVIEKNCINCHSFNQGNPDRFLVHIRGSRGGTYFVDNGEITRSNLKTESMPGSATYPSWHPGGRYVAFSSNQVRQGFYAEANKSIEVYDLISSLIIYDRDRNEILNVPQEQNDTTRYFYTFPSWSPDGKYLYFCRAVYRYKETNPDLEDLEATHYDIARRPFNPETGSAGRTEIVFDAAGIGRSASFPRVSPDGKFLVFTLHDYGTFPIWHQEADLYIIDLETGESKRMDLNSDETDSYHTWSANGKWLVFSSKRTDGRSTRPFFSYIGSWDETGKPFILPQKDPTFYERLMESFNVPEFVTGRIRMRPRDFAEASRQVSLEAKAGTPKDSLQIMNSNMPDVRPPDSDKPIH